MADAGGGAASSSDVPSRPSPSALTPDGFFILNTGARMPAVGLGTWLAKEGEGRAAVSCAISVGYRSIDCAHLYGNEVEVGEALAAAFKEGIVKREDLFVASKLWCTTSAKQRAAKALELSLKNLRVEYLDLFLLHWPTTTPVHLGDATDPPPRSLLDRKSASHALKVHIKPAWQALEALFQKGLVRAIGVSNFSQAQIEELLAYATVVPAVNQAELHPLWRQDSLLNFCTSRGIHMAAHTPLGIPARYALGIASAEQEALLTSWSKAVPPGKGKSRGVLAPMLRHSVVQQLAEKYGRTPAQVLLRWGVQRGTSVLPMSQRPEHIRSNFDVLSWALEPEDWAKLNAFEPQMALIDEKQSYLGEQQGGFNTLQEEDECLEDIPEAA